MDDQVRPIETETPRSFVEAAYETIRHDILTGDLEPGLKLRFEMLRTRYKFGASTLREALTRLAGEALVTSEEQRGFRVAAVSYEDFADLTQARKMIETGALRQSIEAGDDRWEANLVAAFHHLSKVEARLADSPGSQQNEYEARNKEFHEALIAACPSRWLKYMHGILFQQAERYRRISLRAWVEPRDVHAEHKGILDAALARNADLACELNGVHIERTLDLFRRVGLLQKQPAKPERVKR